MDGVVGVVYHQYKKQWVVSPLYDSCLVRPMCVYGKGVYYN